MISGRVGEEDWCLTPPVGGMRLVGFTWSFSPIYGPVASGLPYCRAPSIEEIRAVGAGGEAMVLAPDLLDLLLVLPDSGAQAGQEGGAERGGFDDGRARDRHAE